MVTVETFTTATQLQQTWIINFARRIGLMRGSAKAIYFKYAVLRHTSHLRSITSH